MAFESQQVFEGTWEEVLSHSAAFSGRHVRVIVDPPAQHSVPKSADAPQACEQRRKALAAWIDSHPQRSIIAEDSRDSIYSGTTDDTR